MFYLHIEYFVLKYSCEVIKLSDYKELYLTMFQACEEAIRALTAAQEACEARYGDLTEDEEEKDLS